MSPAPTSTCATWTASWRSAATPPKAREESYLFKERFAGGVISDLELSQNRSQYEEALAIPPLEKAIAQQENGLSVLLGRNPGPIVRGKTIDQLTLPAIVAGLPSDLLERRPDLRQAEQNLIAANAQIGVAKAAYFPAISLTGAFGSASGDLSDLFKGPSKVWQYSAPITLPIFTAGKIAGSVQEAEAIQQQGIVGYQQAIQNAFREVNDAWPIRPRPASNWPPRRIRSMPCASMPALRVSAMTTAIPIT
jgi:outer membrane protein, multidrug efflux system